MCEALSPALLQLHRYPELTIQVLNICCRLLRGMSHAGIGADLNIKESTVKTYRNQALERLALHLRSQLFSLFSAQG